MKEGPKFLSEEEIKSRVYGWQQSAKKERYKNEPRYPFGREERSVEVLDNISRIHGVSLLGETIPLLIAKKKNGEKVKILDIGAGAGFFADEIRNSFSEKVEVFSTGLSKKTALKFREEHNIKGKAKLHPHDLKWRSISELSDFEEFDLIVDTRGEFFYLVDFSSKSSEGARNKIIQYLTFVIKKLRPGGIASISPNPSFEFPDLSEIARNLEMEYGVQITFPDGDSGAIKINKRENT